jgi:hypothetical protein
MPSVEDVVKFLHPFFSTCVIGGRNQHSQRVAKHSISVLALFSVWRELFSKLIRLRGY